MSEKVGNCFLRFKVCFDGNTQHNDNCMVERWNFLLLSFHRCEAFQAGDEGLYSETGLQQAGVAGSSCPVAGRGGFSWDSQAPCKLANLNKFPSPRVWGPVRCYWEPGPRGD